ncbi:hypothetical protein [Rhodococcoides fascians]|uniref:hypothetical protein n=1 Tax=Rhodococcoides fascians TaxID=1828 RepID=UPI00056CC7AC|nr:hypothetical protein [Rhodococcus fascians]
MQKYLVRILLVLAAACYTGGAVMLTQMFSSPDVRTMVTEHHSPNESDEVTARTAPATDFSGPRAAANRALVGYMQSIEVITGAPASVPASVNQARHVCMAVARERMSGDPRPLEDAVSEVSTVPDVTQAMAVQLVAAGMKYACPDSATAPQ